MDVRAETWLAPIQASSLAPLCHASVSINFNQSKIEEVETNPMLSSQIWVDGRTNGQMGGRTDGRIEGYSVPI